VPLDGDAVAAHRDALNQGVQDLGLLGRKQLVPDRVDRIKVPTARNTSDGPVQPTQLTTGVTWRFK